MTSFLMGMASFALSQIYLRLPLLSLFMESAAFTALINSHFLLSGFLIGLSAGIFEEIGRFFFIKFHLKNRGNWVRQALLFGLGHGLMEAIYLLKDYIFAYPLGLLAPALIERSLAILIHMALSILVFKGVVSGKTSFYLPLAILAHGLINFSLPLGQVLGSGLFVYGLLITQSLILFVYAYRLTRRKEKDI